MKAPRRWRDRAPNGKPLKDRAGELFRSVEVPPPSAELEERVQQVLRGEPVRSRLRTPIPALAALAVLLFFVGGATAATAIYRGWQRAQAPAQPKVIKKKRTRPAKRIEPEREETAKPLDTVLPEREVTPPPPAKAAPRPLPKRTTVRKEPAAPKTPDPSRLAMESRRVREAVAALKAGKARDALDKIEAYERDFPNGILQKEVVLTKVSALVAVGRETEALALLDRSRIEQSPRAPELLVLRGELRVRAGRCADAKPDFERALARAPGAALVARAKAGLERCP